jgi:hypothetical protein
MRPPVRYTVASATPRTVALLDLRHTMQGSLKHLTRDVGGTDGYQRLGMMKQSLANLKLQQEQLIHVDDFATRHSLNGFHKQHPNPKLMTPPPMQPKVLISTYR